MMNPSAAHGERLHGDQVLQHSRRRIGWGAPARAVVNEERKPSDRLLLLFSVRHAARSVNFVLVATKAAHGPACEPRQKIPSKRRALCRDIEGSTWQSLWLVLRSSFARAQSISAVAPCWLVGYTSIATFMP